jgi:hypothetical protein
MQSFQKNLTSAEALFPVHSVNCNRLTRLLKLSQSSAKRYQECPQSCSHVSHPMGRVRWQHSKHPLMFRLALQLLAMCKR